MSEKYPGIPKHLVDKALADEAKDQVVDADGMGLQEFLLARQKYLQVMVSLEFQIGESTLRKQVPCRMLTREEQKYVIELQTELNKLQTRLDNPPKTEKALTRLTNKTLATLDKVYELAETICLDPEFTFKFLKENNIAIDVPLTLLIEASMGLRRYAEALPKFRS